MCRHVISRPPPLTHFLHTMFCHAFARSVMKAKSFACYVALVQSVTGHVYLEADDEATSSDN